MTNKRAERRRKKLGAYYTPLELSLALSEWSIRSAKDRVLEPGFGGCEFLFAAYQRLQTLGAPHAMGQLFGCDVDANAFAALNARFSVSSANGRFLKKDFLSLKTSDYPIRGFDVVLGNPPYVPHHLMSTNQINAGQRANDLAGTALVSRRASLWAYFVTHGISFLKSGGRAAWVLPSSFLFADYSETVRALLASSFERVIALRISEKIFTHHQVSEQSIILLCEGKKETRTTSCQIEIGSVKDLQELRKRIQTLQTSDWRGLSLVDGYAETRLSEDCREVLREMLNLTSVDYLGTFIDAKIGLVTGANRFFIVDKSTAATRKLSSSVLVPIITGSEDLVGLSVTKGDLMRARKNNQRCLLIDTSRQNNLSKPTKNYLRRFPIEQRRKNSTFSKREPWHQVNDKRVPDAFFSYMTHHGPKLAVNDARTTSVNSVHRLFKKEAYNDLILGELAISMASSFSQVSAELCGRSYGDGVLKLELGELRRIRVIRVANVDRTMVRNTLKQIDKLYRAKRFANAQDIADEYVLRDLPKGKRVRYAHLLEKTLTALRSSRILRNSQ